VNLRVLNKILLHHLPGIKTKPMSTRIAFFNHKGGVSKTTSVYNIGWKLAETHRVLIVDSDPQCNLTSLILGDDFERYYSEPQTQYQNLKDGVRAAFEGKPIPIQAVTCANPAARNSLFLLAGHATLSEYDAALTFAQTSNNALTTLQNLPGAFSELLRLTEEHYGVDYTLIDMNPSLSSINQNLFVSSDSFIIPTNPDPFSMMALKALEAILPRWVVGANQSAALFQDSAYPMPAKQPKFLGTLIQRFNIRNGRAARPYRENIGEIKYQATIGLSVALQKSGMLLPAEKYAAVGIGDNYCLSEISDFQGLLPKAYNAGVPIYALTEGQIGESGAVLEGAIQKRDLYNKQFTKLASDIVTLLS
jgi:chromosome partitioning protein